MRSASKDRDEAEAQPAGRLPLVALVAITSAMVVSMTIEYLPGGLLPLMNAEFDVGYAQLGLLISVFAAVVVVTTIPLSWVTRWASRKGLLVTALGLIAAASAIVAIAPTFGGVLLARAFGGAAHGLFFSVAAAYVAQLVPREQLGRAISLTALGGTVATIAGTPLGNLLGQLFGWRVSFGMMAVLTAASLAAVVLLLPSVGSPPRPPIAAPASRRPRMLRHPDPTRRPIMAISAVLSLIVAAMTSFGTYSVAWYLGPGGFDALMIPPMLVVSALAGALGLLLNARFSDRHPTLTFSIASLGMVVAVLALPAAGGVLPIVFLSILLGLCWGVVPTILQASTMRVSSEASRAFAGAFQVTAINVGVGMGAFLGGQLILVVGLDLLPLAAGVLLLAGVSVATVLDRRLRRGSTVKDGQPRSESTS